MARDWVVGTGQNHCGQRLLLERGQTEAISKQSVHMARDWVLEEIVGGRDCTWQ